MTRDDYSKAKERAFRVGYLIGIEVRGREAEKEVLPEIGPNEDGPLSCIYEERRALIDAGERYGRERLRRVKSELEEQAFLAAETFLTPKSERRTTFVNYPAGDALASIDAGVDDLV